MPLVSDEAHAEAKEPHEPDEDKDDEVETPSKGQGQGQEKVNGAAEPGPDAEVVSKEGDDPQLLTKGNPLRARSRRGDRGIGASLRYLLWRRTGSSAGACRSGSSSSLVAAWGVMDLLGTFDDADEQRRHATTLTLPRSARCSASLASRCSLLRFALMGGAERRSGRSGAGASPSPPRSSVLVAAIFKLGVKLGPWANDELGLARPLLQRHGFWVVASARSSTCRARQLLALGSVGDPLRRGRARDPRARRLDFALVGAGRLVLVEADPELLDPVARDGHRSARTTSPTRCSMGASGAGPRTPSGSCARRTSS